MMNAQTQEVVGTAYACNVQLKHPASVSGPAKQQPLGTTLAVNNVLSSVLCKTSGIRTKIAS